MTDQIMPLIAGNWKMNGLKADLAEAISLKRTLLDQPVAAEVLICPPATLLAAMVADMRGGAIMVGGQDCHAEQKGAHTGDISAEMLKDAGASHVIIGHSERRADHGEQDADIRSKALAAFRAGLVAILCVGESNDERKAGNAVTRVLEQLSAALPETATAGNLVIAYEPVWAIGSGRTPNESEIIEMHGAIREHLIRKIADGGKMRILYGGSVSPANASEILLLPEVNGALVGGASLRASDFSLIIDAVRKDAGGAC